MSIPLEYQLDMDTNSKSQDSVAELAVAKSKTRTLQKQVNELKQVKMEVEGMKNEIGQLKDGLQELERRRALDEERAAYRQEMLFDSIKRIAEDVQTLKLQVAQDMSAKNSSDSGVQTPKPLKKASHSENGNIHSPPSTKNTPGRASENRKNFERALEHHVQALNKANTMQELKNAGDLAVKYSHELLKNFL